MAFPTEFAFVLPKGYADPSGRIHRQGTMRLATARDEIAPLQDFRVKNNRSYLVVLLLARVVTRLGDLQGEEITAGVIESLYSADLSFLQDLYRQINETGSCRASACCPSCGTSLEVDFGTAQSIAAAS